MLCLFATLSVSMATTTDLSAQQSNNNKYIFEAQLAAESGLAYMVNILTGIPQLDTSTEEACFTSLYDELCDRMNDNVNFQGSSVTIGDDTISIPAIVLRNASFKSTLAMPEDGIIRLLVFGKALTDSGYGSIIRSVSMDFEISTGTAIEYGIYIKGPLVSNNKLIINYTNDPQEASICSGASGVAVTLKNDSYLAGDLLTSDPTATVDFQGSVEVEGDIRLGEGTASLPDLDPSIYAPFATNVLDSSSNFELSSYENIRIKAGTNPNFDADVTIKGVMYIEAPNNVTFLNKAYITGVIATEDPGDGAGYGSHTIKFDNDVEYYSTDVLGDDFAGLKALSGASIIAPNYKVIFNNKLTYDADTIACDDLTLLGPLQGTIHGNILVYGDQTTEFNNEVEITFDWSKMNGPGAGFVGGSGDTALTVVPSTYSEK